MNATEYMARGPRPLHAACSIPLQGNITATRIVVTGFGPSLDVEVWVVSEWDDDDERPVSLLRVCLPSDPLFTDLLGVLGEDVTDEIKTRVGILPYAYD